MAASYLMFVGSYTDFDILAHLPKTKKTGKGIYCFHFQNGQLKPLTTIPSLNPAVLSFHPEDSNTLYALAETIKENGIISKMNYKNTKSFLYVTNHEPFHQRTTGKSLCYFKVDPVSLSYGIAINYWDGAIDVYAMNGSKVDGLVKHIDAMKLAKSLQTKAEALANPRRQVTHREDHWKHRQVGPHAHSVHFYKDWVFVPDLGENCIWQFAWNPLKSVIMEYEAQLKLPDGAGPRHMVFHPHLRVAYVSNELTSSITVLALDDTEAWKKKCRMRILQTINTDKDMQEEEDIWMKNMVAEIGISHDGKFVYCSNRGYDTIAVFKVLMYGGGQLEAVSYVPTYGKTPRHFTITPDDEWLIGANQDSNNLVVFKRDKEKGTLELVTKYEDKEFGAPNYVLLAPYKMDKALCKL
eukprot:169009_1